MFTREQLHKVYSDAKAREKQDYPTLVRDLKKFGVLKYIFEVTDGTTIYYGKNNHTLKEDAKYPPIKISNDSSKNHFMHILRVHQKGDTDFMKFCKDAAESGVVNWISDLEEMNVKYYDLKNNVVYEEKIPE